MNDWRVLWQWLRPWILYLYRTLDLIRLLNESFLIDKTMSAHGGEECLICIWATRHDRVGLLLLVSGLGSVAIAVMNPLE